MRRSPSSQPLRPLLITSNPDLLDELLRLAVRAGVEVEVAPDLPAARRRFGVAPLVLLGVDVLPEGAGFPFPPRHSVLVVQGGEHDPDLMQVAAGIGAEHVVSLPTGGQWLAERLATSYADNRKGKVVAIIGGCGGAGASVLAAALSVTAARSGLRALLVDADPLGGGADLLFGWEREHGLRWPDLAEAGGRFDPEAFLSALPSRGDLVVLACDRAPSAVPSAHEGILLPEEVLKAALEAGQSARDLVVVDLPRRLDAAAEQALRQADRALIVVPTQVRAVAAAARVASAVLAHCEQLSVVVRATAAGQIPDGQIAEDLQLRITGRMRAEPRLAVALERGEPPGANPRGPLASMCQQLIAEVLA